MANRECNEGSKWNYCTLATMLALHPRHKPRRALMRCCKKRTPPNSTSSLAPFVQPVEHKTNYTKIEQQH